MRLILNLLIWMIRLGYWTSCTTIKAKRPKVELPVASLLVRCLSPPNRFLALLSCSNTGWILVRRLDWHWCHCGIDLFPTEHDSSGNVSSFTAPSSAEITRSRSSQTYARRSEEQTTPSSVERHPSSFDQVRNESHDKLWTIGDLIRWLF